MTSTKIDPRFQLSDRTKDRYSGLVLFVLGLGLWLYSWSSLEQGLSGPTEIGPEFFPQFLAIGLMVLSPGLVIKSFVKRDPEYVRASAHNVSAAPEPVDDTPVTRQPADDPSTAEARPADGPAGDASTGNEGVQREKPSAALFVFLLTGAYVLTAEPLGFVPATLITMVILMWLLSVRRWYYYVGLVIFVLGVQYVFETYMFIQLP